MSNTPPRPSQQPLNRKDHPNNEEPQVVANAAPLELLQRAEIDMQIATAKRYPRDLRLVKAKMLSFATLDEDTAASCFYSVPRDGKTIQGPSVRLSEIAFASYGNMRAAARVIDNDGRFITSQAACHDLESNTLISVEVRRRITGRDGRTYSEDMQVVTGNAANSIAFRNAVFKVIPGTIVRPVYDQARLVAVGDASTLVSRRDKIIARLNAMGVSTARILARLEKSGVENIDLMDIESLIGLGTSLRDGDISVDEAFPGVPVPIKTSVPVRQPEGKDTAGNQEEAQQGPGVAQEEPKQEEPRARGTEPDGPGPEKPLGVDELDADELRMLTANLRAAKVAFNRAQLDYWLSQKYLSGQKVQALATASTLARAAAANEDPGAAR